VPLLEEEEHFLGGYLILFAEAEDHCKMYLWYGQSNTYTPKIGKYNNFNKSH